MVFVCVLSVLLCELTTPFSWRKRRICKGWGDWESEEGQTTNQAFRKNRKNNSQKKQHKRPVKHAHKISCETTLALLF
jgi:hypothetical protein